MTETSGVITTTIATTLLFTAISLNALGIYLLTLMRRSLTNQRLILLSLSSSEICLASTELIYWVLTKAGLEEEQSRITQIVVIVNTGLYGSYYLIMILVSFDRLLASVLNLKYSKSFPPKRAKFLLISSWIIGICSCFPFMAVQYDYIYEIYYKIIYLSMDGAFFITTGLTYGYILVKLIRRQKKFQGIKADTRQKAVSNKNFVANAAARQEDYNKNRIFRLRSIKTKERSQYFLVTSMIILSFILFVAIPDVIYVMHFIVYETGSTLEEDIILIVWELNFVLDPAVYIFLQKPVRTLLKKQILKLVGYIRLRKKEEPPITARGRIADYSSTGTFDTRL